MAAANGSYYKDVRKYQSGTTESQSFNISDVAAGPWISDTAATNSCSAGHQGVGGGAAARRNPNRRLVKSQIKVRNTNHQRSVGSAEGSSQSGLS